MAGARVKVPAPALTKPMLPLAWPLPPLMVELIVRSPTVQKLRGDEVLIWLITPPEIVDVLPARTRTPPLETLRRTPLPMAIPALPSMVMEFGATLAVTLVLPEVSKALLLATTALAALYSLAARGRRMEVAVLAVAKEVPEPVALASTSAHGRMPLLAVAAAPV